MEVHYDEGEVLGVFSADLCVKDTVVVELKSAQHTLKDHEVQIANYLKVLIKYIGLFINFGPAGVEVKRKYRVFGQKQE